MQLTYEDLEIIINHTYNKTDRQEFTMKVTRRGKSYRFFLEGYKTDPDKPGVWKLHLLGTEFKKVVASMMDKDLYRDVIELIERKN